MLRLVKCYAEHMEFPKKKWECYTDEDPEEEVVETLEVKSLGTPVEDEYEPVQELPFPRRKAQLEYEHENLQKKERKNKDICNVQVKP